MKRPTKTGAAQDAESAASPDTTRKHDPERTKRNLLEVATAEFAAMGLTGARVDAIAERTHTTKRMLYYYFGSKEGLYEAVLEKAYGDIRRLEQQLDIEALAPTDGLARLVAFSFEYHDKHRDFVRLVQIENINKARYVEHIRTFRSQNSRVIESLAELLARGAETGEFRAGLDATDVHLLISSFCFHRVGNRYTFGAAHGRDPSQPRLRVQHRQMIVDATLRYVRVDGRGLAALTGDADAQDDVADALAKEDIDAQTVAD